MALGLKAQTLTRVYHTPLSIHACTQLSPPCSLHVLSLPSAPDSFSLEGQARLFLCGEHFPFQLSLVGLVTPYPSL